MWRGKWGIMPTKGINCSVAIRQSHWPEDRLRHGNQAIMSTKRTIAVWQSGFHTGWKIDCGAAIKQLRWLKEQRRCRNQVIASAERKEALAMVASQQSAKAEMA
jgi:hypothetical protein